MGASFGPAGVKPAAPYPPGILRPGPDAVCRPGRKTRAAFARRNRHQASLTPSSSRMAGNIPPSRIVMRVSEHRNNHESPSKARR